MEPKHLVYFLNTEILFRLLFSLLGDHHQPPVLRRGALPSHGREDQEGARRHDLLPGLHVSGTIQPIRGQYSDHVICHDQSEANIQVA